MAEKSLDAIKTDILNRAGRVNPFERVKKEDVEQVVKNLTSLDADLWGREWGKFGLKYEAFAEEQDKQGEKKAAGETYYLAYEYYRIGRYPVPSSSEKMNCYRGALRTFLKAGPTMEPPLERIEIPFEGKKIAGLITTSCLIWVSLVSPWTCRAPVKIRVSVTIRTPNELFPRRWIISKPAATSTANGSPAWAAASAATGRRSSPIPNQSGCAAR